MHQFINKDKDWKVIDYTEREHAFEKMYLHLIDRLEQAIKKLNNKQLKSTVSSHQALRLLYLIIILRK